MNLKIIILLITYSLLNSKIDSSRFESWHLAGLTKAYNNISDTVKVNALEFGIINDGIFNNSPTLNTIISNKLQYAPKWSTLLEIYFPNGKYRFGNTINLKSNIALKGEGFETQFIFNMGGSAINCINISGSPSSNFDTLKHNLSRGNKIINSRLFTLKDLAFKWVEILQDNGSWNTNPADWDKNAVGQIEQVTYFIEDSAFGFNSRIKYDTLQNARFRIIKPIENASVECLSIERLDEPKSGAGYNIYLGYAVNCKISGIESNKSVGSHCMIEASSNNYVCNSYFHDAFTYDGSGTRGYGVTLGYHCNMNLVENNVFKHLRHAMMVKQGANANVFAYNYSLEPNRSEPIADFSGDISLHGHYPFGNLFEGNICQNIIIDHFWGPSGDYNTFFRNRAENYGIIMTTNSTAGGKNTSNQNFIANEVTSSAFLKGNYTLVDTGHFEMANNIKGKATPSVIDSSYLVSSLYINNSKPKFWDNLISFPSIGYPNKLNEKLNSAKKRYDSSKDISYCESINTTKVELDEYSKQYNFNNLVDFINIDTKELSNFELYNLQGKSLDINVNLEIKENEIQLKNLESGIYFLRFKIYERNYFVRIIKSSEY